jgi:hypothetical protein
MIDDLFITRKSSGFKEVSICTVVEFLKDKIILEGISTDKKDDSVKIVDIQVGSPGSVEFDFLKILDHMRSFGFNPKDEESPFSYGFIHNHPPGFGSSMSAQDVSCARGLLKGYGMQKLHFYIVCFDNDNVGNISGNISLYVWSLSSDGNLVAEHNENLHVNIPISSVKLTNSMLTMLRFIKFLSYKEYYPV